MFIKLTIETITYTYQVQIVVIFVPYFFSHKTKHKYQQEKNVCFSFTTSQPILTCIQYFCAA